MTTSRMPGLVARPEGLLKSLLLEVAKTALGGKYETYECPACGSKVVYYRYRNAHGEVFKRLADEIRP
jgi:DNA-directed RNA polymerase subunit RPC12/RpoP